MPMKPTELDSMNRLRVEAERKAALYRRALVLACFGDKAKVAFYLSEADADQADDSGVPETHRGNCGIFAPSGGDCRCTCGVKGLDAASSSPSDVDTGKDEQ